jgi:hypothetical protein
MELKRELTGRQDVCLICLNDEAALCLSKTNARMSRMIALTADGYSISLQLS